ncbi:hypothetical protein K432DRAFT_378709 [Lepidopterella palustris CBS 459.81]|uniref:Uncharacterized protein n=1 Tax=Lepidopterella palustris CBS 459.81 TaxID=1314670 RepID=A0A8E2EI09_9PEZI|nr:hypothetical protein K432DRAFT_378709 [Lepidopterella palustris CBS 459.81]
MPPSTPRTLLSLPTSQLGSAFSIPRRCLSSSPYYLALGPESPNYIEVPKPVQPTYPRKPIVKGVLPIPRNIFQTRSENEKSSKEFLDAATKEPTTSSRHPSRDAARMEWKKKLADIRRNNLRQGVMELHERKIESERRESARGSRKRQEREDLVNRPERDDERLTNPSVSKDIRDFMEGKFTSGLTPEQIEEKRRTFELREVAKEAKRREALHTLYMQAKDFITTSEALDEAVEKAFGPDEAPVSWHGGSSVWEQGTPDAVQDMLANSASRRGDRFAIADQRIKRIAEELTGGKL